MITAGQVKEILSLYKKHGWILRRVLLSDVLRGNLPKDFFAEAEIVSAPIDALWFSRNETWEIRHLSNTPFALVEVFSAEMSDEEREEKLSELQSRLMNRTSK